MKKPTVFVMRNYSDKTVEIAGQVDPDGGFKITTKPSGAHVHLDDVCTRHGDIQKCRAVGDS